MVVVKDSVMAVVMAERMAAWMVVYWWSRYKMRVRGERGKERERRM